MLAVLEPATACCQCTLPAAASASLLRLVQTAYRQLAAAVRLVLAPKGALSAWHGMRTVLAWAMVGLVWPDGDGWQRLLSWLCKWQRPSCTRSATIYEKAFSAAYVLLACPSYRKLACVDCMMAMMHGRQMWQVCRRICMCSDG